MERSPTRDSTVIPLSGLPRLATWQPVSGSARWASPSASTGVSPNVRRASLTYHPDDAVTERIKAASPAAGHVPLDQWLTLRRRCVELARLGGAVSCTDHLLAATLYHSVAQRRLAARLRFPGSGAELAGCRR